MTRRLQTFIILLTTMLSVLWAGACAQQQHDFSSNSCVQLQPGESREIRDRSGPLPAKYLLERSTADAGSQYLVTLSLAFKGETAEDGSLVQPLVERLNGCLTKLDAMLTTSEGESLRIRIKEVAEADAHFTIRLGDQFRDQSDFWNRNISCGVAIHEIFHLLGLVDEYKELSFKADGEVSRFDCRSPVKTDSIMSVSGDYALALVSAAHPVRTCTCPASTNASSNECQEALKKLRGAPGTCPAGSMPGAGELLSDYEQHFCPSLDHPRESARMAKAYEKRLSDYRIGLLSEDGTAYSYIEATQPKKLLYQNEFRAIVNPGCTEKNSVYYKCIQNAYRTSSVEGCLTVPSECADGSWVGGRD